MPVPRHPYDPKRLDVERFARDGACLEGAWPLAGMTRLMQSCDPDAAPGPGDVVRWQARGESRRVGGEDQIWLELDLDATAELTCQRCLCVVATPLRVRRRFRFVSGEAQAAALDAAVEEDVLAASRSFDLRSLAEDELLLALPIVARHERCPKPLVAPADPAIGDGSVPAHPFAALADLKKVRH